MTTVLDQAAVETLSVNFRGEVITPADERFDEARAIFNGMINKRPALIAQCNGVADVISALGFARERGLSVAVRAGGHSVPGHCLCGDEGIVIDLSGMKGIWVDPVAQTARVQTGVLWGELDRETQQFGLAVTGGRISTTGVAGLTLGSGSGWFERAHGLTSDSLIAADMVTADGNLVRASSTENPDLFWGLRGGSGNFGIVTSFEFRLQREGPLVYGGLAGWPRAQAPQVLRAFRDFMKSAPNEIGFLAALITAPPEPFIPEELRGQPIVALAGCCAGDPEKAAEAMRPLLEEMPPALNMLAPMPYVVVQQLLDAGNPKGLQGYFKADFVPELSDEAIETIVDQASRITSPFTALLLEPLGGAINDVPEEDSALSRPRADFVYHALVMWEDPAENDRQIAWTRGFADAVAKYTVPGVYLNFLIDEDEEARVRSTYGPEKYDRLVALKDKYDPDNVFRHNYNIKPSGAAAR
ncbi:MAG TPA: FAD-binding oxidoreductase [Thermoleophilaceae bacterium]